MMKTSMIGGCLAALLFGTLLASCEKKYETVVPDDVGTGGGSGVITADTFQFSSGWIGETLPVLTDSGDWVIGESLGHFTIDDLAEGDRVFAVLQVGLQWPYGSCGRTVSLGTILCDDTLQTPSTTGIVRFSEDTWTETWPNEEWIKQFTRYEEVTVPPGGLTTVHGYVKVWSPDGQSGWDDCNITNRSLSLVVVRN